MRYLLVLVVALALAGPASASPAPPPSTGAPAAGPASSSAPTNPATGGVLAAPDTTAALGGTDAACSPANLRGASATVVRNCTASGLAQSAYPPGNYESDTNVDTGGGFLSLPDFAKVFAQVAQNLFGWILGIMAHVLTWILLGLALAFNFDLFRSDHTGQIAHGLATAENLFTFPLLPIFLVIGAVVGVGYWAAERAEGRAVVHWVAMLAMMGAALVIIQNPVGVFGWADTASNEVASGAVSAFTGQGGAGTAGFSNAAPGLWKTTMEEPWCAMEFGDVNWCMAPISPWMAAARQSVLAHLPDALGQGTPFSAAQEPVERLRLADATTNGELFLSFLPNADARNGTQSWTLYHALRQNAPNLAEIRGAGGVGEHISILVLTAIAGIFFLILLLYIAWQLIVNSVFFVLCLLLTPVMIFAPAFGESGRGIFLKWLAWTVEALFKKVVFAIYLGVVLLVTNVFYSVGSAFGGWLVQWLLLAGIWAMAFLYRHRILGLMTGGLYQSHGSPNTRRWHQRPDRPYDRGPRVTEEVHVHEHSGDTNFQHLHVYGNGDRPEPRRVRSVSGAIDGTARELRP